MADSGQALTDKKYWSEYWENQLQHSSAENYFGDKYSKELLFPFQKYLSGKEPLSVMEIGGFPGNFLLALGRKYNLKKVSILDYYSEQTGFVTSDFNKQGCELVVYKKDLYEDSLSDVIPYDVVYSMGFVEHYSDIEKTTQKHLDCLKKDGILIIGMPVFLGVNKWLAKYLSPDNYKSYYTHIMNSKIWEKLPEKLDIELLHSKYVGGFNPLVHHRLEQPDMIKKIFYVVFHKLAKIWNAIPYTVNMNSKYFSYYYYVVYRKKN